MEFRLIWWMFRNLRFKRPPRVRQRLQEFEMKKYLVVLAIIAQLSLPIFAQQPEAQKPQQPTQQQEPKAPLPSASEEDVVRITTNLVQVDAVVTDKSGKVVTDLKPEEVQIFEDARAQKITHFSYIVADSSIPSQPPKPTEPLDKNAPPPPPVTLRPEQVRRTIALVVDDLGLSFESCAFVRQALKKFVDQQMQPGDLVAIIRTGGGIGALQQFTSDKRMLYAAIERVRWNALGRSGISAFAPIEDTSNKTDEQQAADEDFNQFREDLFAVGTLGAISYVVKGLRELPGRKSILLISDGFRIYSRDDPTRNYRALERLRQLIDQANRSSVVIYTMNATGLQTLNLTAADSTGQMTPDQIEQQLSNRRSAAFDTQEGMDYLAKQTGGLAIRNTNDLAGGIRRVMQDQRGYYLIGYRPDESTFDPRTGRRKFHHLSLKVTRPGKFNVRMRNGFYGVSDEERTPVARTPQQQITSALVSPFGASGVHVRLTSLFGNDAKLGSFMRSLLHVNGSDLTFTDEPDGWHQAVFDVVAITFGDNGNVVDRPLSRTHTLRVRGDAYKDVLKEGFVYFITVPIKKPGAYQLRAALRDHGSERVGSASQFVEVPDIKKNRLTLSGVVVTGIEPQAKKKQESSGAANPPAQNPAGDNADRDEVSDPTNSAAVRQFHRGEILQYGFAIYNAHLDKNTSKTELQIQARLFRDGQAVFTGKEQPFNLNNPTDLKRLGASGALLLGTEMTPGEYVLQVVVTDQLADQKHRVATQSIDFEVVK
jgi:VWFA-related protein